MNSPSIRAVPHFYVGGIASRVRVSVPAQLKHRLRSAPVLGRALGALANIAGPAASDEAYTPEYFQMVEETSSRGVAALAQSIVETLSPNVVVDVGCGTGVLLANVREFGVQVFGYDNSQVALNHCNGRGIRADYLDLVDGDIPSLQDADVAICLEVAHLIDECAADRCVAMLTTVANAVVFSAGRPGQKADHLRNLQPHTYWVSKFQANGFQLDLEMSKIWRSSWRAGGVAPWFHENVMLFKRA